MLSLNPLNILKRHTVSPDYPDLLDAGIVSPMGEILDMTAYRANPIYRGFSEGLTEAKAQEIYAGFDDLRNVYGGV